MKIAEMGILLKFPANKGEIDLSLLFPLVEKLRTEVLFPLHRAQPSVLEMLLKTLSFYFSSRFPPNRSLGFVFLKPYRLPLEFTPDSINLSDCGVCMPAGGRVERGRLEWGAQKGATGSVCGEGQGLLLTLPW